MLIAYFSHTGNTAKVAEQIHALTGAKLFRIESAEKYPAEHDPCSELAGRQLRANYRPTLKNKVDDMGQYSLVFLGYPIWWHTMPMPCWTFLETYDFSGKTIAPFCTSGGDRIARSIEDIRMLAPKAKILEGYQTTNAYSPAMPQNVKNWLENTGVIQR